MPNWSVKVEYLYYDLGTASAANVLSAAVPAGSLLYGSFYQTSTHFNGHVVRVGVNYHFQWFSPARGRREILIGRSREASPVARRRERIRTICDRAGHGARRL